MAKAQVSTELPIEFSEVCEVVYQDLAGTNGRTLVGCFTTANASGKSYDANYVGIKDRLSNFRGFPFINPGTGVNFDADYAIIEYNFTAGQDLDIRTNIKSPVASDYIGWSRLAQFPPTNPYLKWGGDNQGTGVETVFIDITQYKLSYPSTNMVIDMRAFWYLTLSTTPVVFKLTLYKGGTPVAPNMSTTFNWQISNPTASLILTTSSKEIKLLTVTAANNAQSVGTFEYNPSNFFTKVTLVTDNTPPSTPVLTLNSVTSTTATFSFTSTDANSPVLFALHRTDLGDDRVNSANAWWNLSSPFTVTGLTTGTAYSFYVKAFDPTGNYSGASNTVVATPTA